MGNYVVKKLGQSIVAFVICSFLCFVLVRQLPGSIAYSLYGANAQKLTGVEQTRLEQALLGDASLVKQYMQWFKQFLSGDWGYSFSQQQSVLSLMKEQTMYTATVVVVALLVTNVCVTLFFYGSHHAKLRFVTKVFDYVFLFAMIVPGFWFSFLMLWLFTVPFPIFPSYGVDHTSLWSYMYHLLLPSIALAVPAVFYGIKLLEDQLKMIVQQPFFQQLTTQSLRKTRYMQHLLPHISLVYLQLNGYLIPAFIGGTLAIETIFSIPGLGKLTVEATKLHDYPTLLVIMLMLLIVILLAQLLIDLISSRMDPRIYKSLKD